MFRVTGTGPKAGAQGRSPAPQNSVFAK